MTVKHDPNSESPIFSAVITPHRSLGRQGFVIVMLLLSGTSFAAGMVFLLAGAWPIMGFFGLDVMLVYWAFRASYRSAAAYELVTVTPSELKVCKVSERGHAAEWSMNPLWTKLDRSDHEEFGIEQLCLVSRGHRLAIATFLGRAEKESFASALAAALGEAKRGLTRSFPA
jgi:uncharacterized membrane protein